MKKTLALILTFIMVLALVPSVALAASSKDADIDGYLTVEYKVPALKTTPKRDVNVEVYVNYGKVAEKTINGVAALGDNLKLKNIKSGLHYGVAANNHDTVNGSYDNNTLGFNLGNKNPATLRLYLFTFDNGHDVDFTRYVNLVTGNWDSACSTLRISYTLDGQKYSYDYTKWDQTHTTYVPNATDIYVTPTIKSGYKFEVWRSADAFGDGANRLYSIKNGQLVEEQPTYTLPGIGTLPNKVAAGSYALTENMAFYIGSGYGRIQIALYMSRDNEQEKVTHTLTYDTNGGAGTFDVQSYGPTTDASHEFTIHEGEPTRDGYKFLGWADSKDADKPKYRPNSTITVSGDKIIYAVWEEVIPEPDIEKLVGDITVKCVTAANNHEEKQTTLIDGSYTVSPIVNNHATVKIKSEEYVKFYNGQVTGDPHTITGDTEKTIDIAYDAEQKMWVVVEENALPVVFTVQHDVPMGDSGFVKVKKEFKGLPYGTFPKEALFKVKQGDKEIANIYVTQNNGWGANKTTQLLPGDYTVEEIIYDDVQVEGYILTAPEAKNFTIVAGQITEVTFTNEYVEEPFPGVITVKKTVDSNVPADKNKEFNFKVTVLIPIDPNPDPFGPPNAKSANAAKAPAVRGANKTATKDAFVEENDIWTLRFTLKGGDMMTISDLPVGFTYRVEELDAAGYTVTVNNETTTSKDVGLTKENPTETLNFKNTKGSTPTPTPYNGGGGHGHYHPSATPVPVMVIPPKTGDMTLLQYIARLLGLVR